MSASQRRDRADRLRASRDFSDDTDEAPPANVVAQPQPGLRQQRQPGALQQPQASARQQPSSGQQPLPRFGQQPSEKDGQQPRPSSGLNPQASSKQPSQRSGQQPAVSRLQPKPAFRPAGSLSSLSRTAPHQPQPAAASSGLVSAPVTSRPMECHRQRPRTVTEVVQQVCRLGRSLQEAVQHWQAGRQQVPGVVPS